MPTQIYRQDDGYELALVDPDGQDASIFLGPEIPAGWAYVDLR